jgi:stalled ribosome rescue protein Dom34
MTPPLQAAVWIDHHEARIFHVEADRFDESVLNAPRAHIHRHPKGATEEHHHPDDVHHFFDAVAKALHEVDEILVLGPSTAKLQFIRHLHGHAPALEKKVVGLETVDHPTDRQIVAYAKRYFGVPLASGR